MYMKMMGVNNDCSVVYSAITRCQVQRWYMLARWCACSVLIQSWVKMVITSQQRAQCVIWYAKFSSVVNTQWVFRHQYNVRHVPSHWDIVKWYNMFLENGLQMLHTGGRRRDGNKEEVIRQAMTQSPWKSLSRISAQQNKPYTTCHRIVRSYLNMCRYRVQRMHALTQLNYEARSILLRWCVSGIKVTTNG
jgi:hypothetical protein